MDQRHRTYPALLNALRVLLVVCITWLAPMPAVAMTGSAPGDGHMIAMQAHCVAVAAKDGTSCHTGMSHQMTCCLVCAGTTFVGHFVMPINLANAVQTAWLLSGSLLPTSVGPDPALRLPNTTLIA